MARTFSLSLVVALLLVFAITEASRGQTNQTDEQKIQNRGTTRYNSKSTTESSNLSASETRKPPRDKNSRSISNLEKHFETHFAKESSIRSRSKLKQSQAADNSTATLRTSSRHLNTSDDNSQNRQKSHVTQSLKDETRRNTHDDNKKNTPESQTLKRLAASRRSSEASPIWVNNAKLDHEVFTKSDHSRSRTGRKIYMNHGRESKGEVILSRTSPENENVDKTVSSSNEPKKEEARGEHSKAENVISKVNASKKIDMKSANSSSSRKDEAKDVLLSGSESIRVDVPLTVGNAEDVNLLKSSTTSSVNVSLRQASRPIKESNDIARSNAKKNRQSDRSKSHSRSKTRDPNLETANSGSTSRRGSSRFDGTAIAETNGRSSNSRHRSNAKNVNSRSRSAHKSRDVTAVEARNSGRQRSADTDSETNKNRRTETRRNDRRTSEGKRRSKDGRSKAVEDKIDEQDIRTQSRSRSRAATNNLDITTAYIPKATIAEATTVPFVNAEITTSNSATIRSSTTVRTSSSTERASRNKGRDRGESSRTNKLPKEDFFNHGLGFRGRKTSTEGSSSIAADSTTTTTTTPRSETQLSRGNPGWTLRRRPHVNQDASFSTAINRDQTNEILPNDSPRSTETPSTTKAGQRGTKRPKAKDESNTVSSVAAKNVTRGSKTFNKFESFSLPGRDKGVESESDNYPPAFRARLSQLKNSNSKPTEGKSTARTSLQATKPSLANLFSERSKLKLELARRLIKPELNVDENNFDVTTAAYSGKTKEVSTVSESRNVEKTTKAINKLIGTRVTQGSSTSAPKEKSTARGRWKIFETRKSSKDRNIKAPFRSPVDTIKKSRMTSERAVAPSFVEETSTRSVTEFNAIPRLITISNRGAGPLKETTVDATKVRSPTSTMTSREESSTLTNTVETIEENSIITTIESLKLDKFIETITAPSDAMSITDASTESKVHPTEFLQEVTLSPTVTTPSSMLLSSTPSTAKSEKLYPVYIPDTKEYGLSDKEKTATTNDSSSVRPRYTKQEQPDKVAISMVTSRTVGPTSRYIRKKTGVFTPYDAVPKSSSTETTFTQTKRREFRPRTSTYRRHSEIPTSQVQQSATVEQTTTGVTITPKSTKYHAQVVTPSAPRFSSSEPFVSVRIDTTNNTTPQVSGVTESSNGNSGNSNVFNPTRSTYLNANTTTLLEQLRSTVAPLLNNLGEKTPIFSGAYSNVNTGNSAPRITPNGSPPRFSARYKGAELFVRKPSNNQAVIPSITTSSTTASTPIENSGSAPPVDINSPGEPRFVTFYQALESASIRNENLGAEDVSQRQRLTGVVTKVDPNATVPNGASNDTANNNDTIAPSITATTTSSPDTTTVNTTTVQSTDNSLASRLGAESSTDSSETATTTVQTPTNPDTNGGETTPVSISESSGTVPVNTITNTPSSNANVPDTTEPFTTTETATSTSVVDVTLAALFSTESIPNDIQSTEPIDTSIETTSQSITETVNADVSMSTSQQTASDIPNTTISFPITENVTVTPEATMPAMNNMSENIETNTVQQSEETTPRTTEMIVTVENVETSTVQQFDATVPFQTMETTSTTEPITTEEISNDVIEIHGTAAPAFTSTYRTRLIDYAQEILSRLSQNGFSTIKTPIQKSTVTMSVFPELSNAIPDSSSTNTESPAQPEETTAVQEAGPSNVGTTVSSDVEFVPTTMNGSELTTQNTVGLGTTSQSNGQETNVLDSSTTTGQTLSNIVSNERNATSDFESTTVQDTQTPSIDGEIATTITPTTTPRLVEFITENDPRSNDTLLAELMTIAKTLFTEAMNDTRQSIQTDGTVGNDNKNQSVSVSNDTSEATTTPSELSKFLESNTEFTDVTTSVDLFGNERRDNSSRGPVVGSKILLMESTARPADVENSIDIGDVTMSLSQIKTETTNTTMVMASMSSELTTNTPDSQLSNPIESFNNNTEQQIITTILNNEVQLSNQLSEFAMDLTTNNPLTNSVTINTEEMLPDVNESTTSDMVTELTTSVAMTKINVVQTNAVDTTNQIPEPTTIVPASDLQVINDQSLVANASDIATTLPTVSDTSNSQPFGTESPITESVRNLISSTDTTTNQLNDITTNVPQTLTDLVSEMPNLIARLQDTTATTTAQGTAGSRIIQLEQTTEIITSTTIVPTVTTSSTASITNSTTSPVSSTDATTIPPSSIEPTVATMTTETTTMTFQTTSTEALSRLELTTTVRPTSEMTTTTVDENLVSTETMTNTSTMQDTTIMPTELEDLNMISRNDGEETTNTAPSTMSTTTSAALPMDMSTTTTSATSTTSSTTARTTVLNRISPFPVFTPSGMLNTARPYMGGSQMTPIQRLSSSKAPVRDYLIYGIYPNKTIVRKRPEDNLIDGRNVDSPYVIFGIYPDGRLVRKFPNGTIIPDSPRNPVEVVFTLRTTTTTNRPAPRPYYNQANQAGIYNNQYQAPVYYSNGRPVDELTGGVQSPGFLDFGLIGNAIGVTPGGPNFAGLFSPSASVSSTNKMSDILLNSQMGTLPNGPFSNLQTPNSGQVQGPIGPPRIVQDRERNEASRTRVTSDQRSAVYIGQDKFINYQIDGAPVINPKVVDVRINSVATSVNEGTASSTASTPSFENLLNNQSDGGVITAPPGFPWRDPLDQIFGITTNSPIQTASVASNQLDEPTENRNAPIMSRPLDVEIFTVMSNATPTSTTTTTTASTTTTTSTTTPITTTASTTTPTTTTTTTASTTTPTTTTTTASTTTPTTTTTTTTSTTTPTTTTSTTTTTTTTTPAPTTAATTTTTTTSTPATTMTSQTTTTGSGTIPSSTASIISDNILSRLQANSMENPFGTTFGDLAFLNTLLQNNNDVKSTTPKTLNEVEQILANRILSLALANPGPTRSPKAIQTVNLNTNVNAINRPSSGLSSEPIIIDLLPLTSSSSYTSPTKKYAQTIATQTSIAPIITTRAPVVITAKSKTTAKPKTTTPRPSVGFGAGLWRALFGDNFFKATTAASAAEKKPAIKATTQKFAGITQTPAQIAKSTLTSHTMPMNKSPTTRRSVDISDIHVASSTSFTDNIVSASTPSAISTTFLNNPNPKFNDVSTSTYSPEDDAKFLAALLRTIQTETKTSTSATTQLRDDEAFLRAILNNQISISTTTSSSTEINPAALLALFLKQQGIEPTTPATKLREQLSSLGLMLDTGTSTTTRPTTTNRPDSTARQVVTSRPSARPRSPQTLQTTTWSPSSTYPPPLFGGSGSSGSGLVTATRAIGRFLGAAISGAAQQLQSLLRNSTRSAAG